MNNKPKMYHNIIDKEINNNKLIYTSYDKNQKNDSWSANNIREKIDEIVRADNFIYSKMVNLIVGNDVIKRKIIGLYNNNLVTIDNEYIPIENIKDIYI